MSSVGSARKRVVVKVYGGETVLFGLLTPILATFMVGLGLWRPRGFDARVLERAERDATEMARRGYRTASSDWYEPSLFGMAYLRVTYELAGESTVPS